MSFLSSSSGLSSSEIFRELDELKKEMAEKEFSEDDVESMLMDDDLDSILKELEEENIDDLDQLLNELESFSIDNEKDHQTEKEDEEGKDNSKKEVDNVDKENQLEFELPPEINQIMDGLEENLNYQNKESMNSKEGKTKKEKFKKEDDTLDSLVDSVIDMNQKNSSENTNNVFKTVLSTLLSTNKIDKSDVQQILFKLNEKGILNKKEVSDMFFDLTN